MIPLLACVLCFAVVAMSGGSLQRKGRIRRGMYAALLALAGVLLAAVAILRAVAGAR